MAYCPSCGTEATDNARFCSQCGAAMQAKAGAAPAAKAAGGDGQSAASVSSAEPMWTGWPCRKRHLPKLALALLIVIGSGIGAAAGAVPLLILSVAGLLWCLWILGKMVLEPIDLRYWVTADRLFIRRGILWRTTDQMELIRVDDLQVTQGPVERLMGIGNVKVMAESDPTENKNAEENEKEKDVPTLLGIAEPAKVAEIIRENMRRLRQKRGMFIENV